MESETFVPNIFAPSENNNFEEEELQQSVPVTPAKQQMFKTVVNGPGIMLIPTDTGGPL